MAPVRAHTKNGLDNHQKLLEAKRLQLYTMSDIERVATMAEVPTLSALHDNVFLAFVKLESKLIHEDLINHCDWNLIRLILASLLLEDTCDTCTQTIEGE